MTPPERSSKYCLHCFRRRYPRCRISPDDASPFRHTHNPFNAFPWAKQLSCKLHPFKSLNLSSMLSPAYGSAQLLRGRRELQGHQLAVFRAMFASRTALLSTLTTFLFCFSSIFLSSSVTFSFFFYLLMNSSLFIFHGQLALLHSRDHPTGPFISLIRAPQPRTFTSATATWDYVDLSVRFLDASFFATPLCSSQQSNIFSSSFVFSCMPPSLSLSLFKFISLKKKSLFYSSHSNLIPFYLLGFWITISFIRAKKRQPWRWPHLWMRCGGHASALRCSSCFIPRNRQGKQGAGWIAGLLVCLRVCWMDDWWNNRVISWQAGSVAGWWAGLVAVWLACKVAGRWAGLGCCFAGWLVGYLAGLLGSWWRDSWDGGWASWQGC